MIRSVAYEAMHHCEAEHDLDELLHLLAAEFPPVLRPARTAQHSVLGWPAETVTSLRKLPPVEGDDVSLAGELFRGPDEEMFALLITATRSMRAIEDRPRLRIEVLHHAAAPSAKPAARFLGMIEAFFNTPCPTAYDQVRFTSPFAHRWRAEHVLGGAVAAPRPSADVVRAASVLAHRLTRACALEVKKTRTGVLASAVAERLSADQDEVASTFFGLAAAGLIAMDSFIRCTASQQVARNSESDATAHIPGLTLCPTCSPRCQAVVSDFAGWITQDGARLLDKSTWMTALVVEALSEAGFDPDAIFVERQVGAHEIDVLAYVTGRSLLIELKDKEFNLGETFSFSAKQRAVRPTASMIVTTARVGGDARRELAAPEPPAPGVWVEHPNDHPGTPVYVEGLDQLDSALQGLLDEFGRVDAEAFFARALPFAALPAEGLVRHLDSTSVRDHGEARNR